MSTTSEVGTSSHPIAAFAVRLHAVLDTVGEAPVWSMSADEQRGALLALARDEARLTGLRLRVLAAADASDVAGDTAASSIAAWVAHQTRQARPVAHADLTLARRLDAVFDVTREALAAGSVDREQARVIVRALDALPGSVPAEDRRRAEQHLVELAQEHDATALRVLGRRVLEVVDPDLADLEEGRKLDAEEAAAARATHLRLFDNGDGTHTGRFKISTLHAAMLKKALQALTAPRQPTERSRRPDRSVLSRPEQMGEAFCELLERLPADRLPTTGGVSATVVVLLDYEKLMSGLCAARLDTGERLSAGLARRLACEAGVIPAVYRRVLGGPSVVLDLGRRRRLHTEHQRIAMTIRDGGCTAEGCDRPPGWTHAHHEVAWAQGGGTSVQGGRLLCPFHHRRAHRRGYDMTRLPNGRVEFHRRT